MRKSPTKFYHYILVMLCCSITATVAAFLGVHDKAAGAIVLTLSILLSIGEIHTFFYYFILAITEAFALLILSIITKNFLYMVLPLVPLGFSVIFFGIQLLHAVREEKKQRNH